MRDGLTTVGMSSLRRKLVEYGLVAACAGTGSGHSKIVWPVRSGTRYHWQFCASLSVHNGLTKHTKVVSDVLTGRASRS
eukprot:1036962-Pleurochrysis_carterae.AAC.1